MRTHRKSIFKKTALFLIILHTTVYAFDSSLEDPSFPKRVAMMCDASKEDLKKLQSFLDKITQPGRRVVDKEMFLSLEEEEKLKTFSAQHSKFLGMELTAETLKKTKETTPIHNKILTLLKKTHKEIRPIFNEIICGNTKNLRYLTDATYGRRDCQEQTMLTLRIVLQKKTFDELPKETQDLLALQFLLTDRNFRDPTGMVVHFEDQKSTQTLTKETVSELKRLLAESTLNHTLSLAKKYELPCENLQRFEGKMGLRQLPALASIEVFLKFCQENHLPFLLKHIQLQGDEEGQTITLQDTKLYCFDVNDDKYQYVEKPADEHAPTIGARLYSVLKKGEVFSDLSQVDLREFLLQQAYLFGKREGEPSCEDCDLFLSLPTEEPELLPYVQRKLDGDYTYTGKRAPMQIVHIYPCTFAQQRHSIEKPLAFKDKVLGPVAKTTEDDRLLILKGNQ